jgi:hypothetical protein
VSSEHGSTDASEVPSDVEPPLVGAADVVLLATGLPGFWDEHALKPTIATAISGRASMR